MRTKGISPQYTKQSNRLLVLRLLCSGESLSRTEITRRVGLTKMTVSNITGELLRAGLIEEAPAQSTGAAGVGRPRLELRLTDRAPAVIGLFLNRDGCVGIAATMDLKILCRSQAPLGPGETGESLLGKMEQLARRLEADCGREEVLGVGIAAIGPLNQGEGRLLDPPDFYGIHHVDLTGPLSRRLERPVFLLNDMDAAALAEKLYGCGAPLEDFAYVGLSNGVGAGLVLGGSLFRGSQGFVGELGHTTIDYRGPQCACGRRGCLETYISLPRILERFRAEVGEAADFRQLCTCCDETPAGAALMEDFLEKLSIALVNLCNLIDPQAVIIGHGGAFLTDGQLARAEELVNRNVFARTAARIPLLRSSFADDAALYGAAVLPLKKVFDGELRYGRFFGEEEKTDTTTSEE